MSTPITITFWGVRGSHPVPGAGTVHFGGNTSCVEVNAGGRTIILDAGTGIIELGRSLASRARQSGTPIEAAILFSHFHHDHVQGFPFFTPAYFPTARLNLIGSEAFNHNVEAVLSGNQTPPVFPVRLQEMGAGKAVYTIQEGDTILLGGVVGIVGRQKRSEPSADEVRIRTYRSYAHPGGVMVYRIEYKGRAVVYATDTEGYVGTDRRLVAFAEGADLLIHDAQYTEEHYRGERAGFPATQGFGHSTPVMACEVAAAANVKQLVLFHHNPAYDDAMIRAMETQASRLFPNTSAAYEGLTITLDAVDTRRRSQELATV